MNVGRDPPARFKADAAEYGARPGTLPLWARIERTAVESCLQLLGAVEALDLVIRY